MSLMRPFTDIQSQMDRLFSDISQSIGLPYEVSTSRQVEPLGGRMWMPSIEISENDNDIKISAEIPGVKPEEIDVEVSGNQVTISGEYRHEEKRTEGRNVHRSEFRYGRFLRRIPLPSEVKSENAKAEFHHGILELTLPKAEESKRRKLKIQSK